MNMVGLSPSVVRACIMQIALLLAPLFRRDSDSFTSLGMALLVILLGNPFAAASVSFQLSFAATFGIVILSGRLYRLFFDWYQGKNKHVRRVLAGAAGGLLLQHTVAGVAAGQPAGGACGGVRLHGVLRHGAGGLRVASGGQSAGLGGLWSDPCGAVDRVGLDPMAVSRRLFR